MVTGTQVLEFVGGGANDTAYAASCAESAMVLVDEYIGDSVVPVTILDRAHLLVAAEMFNQKDAPQGIAQFSDSFGNTAGMRVARDPMRAAYSILSPFLAGGFA